MQNLKHFEYVCMVLAYCHCSINNKLDLERSFDFDKFWNLGLTYQSEGAEQLRKQVAELRFLIVNSILDNYHNSKQCEIRKVI